MYMAEVSSSLFAISGGLTILYFIIKSFVSDKPTTLKVVTYLYYILLMGGVVGVVYSNTSEMCGEIQWLYGFVYGVLPWVLIYGVFSLLLHLCPGWKMPFSNTFGYLYAKIKGVSSVLNKMINTSYKSKDIQNIYNDPSLLINTLTPVNFTDGIKRLISDKILNPSRVNFSDNLSSLQHIVTVKDDISECIWKILVAGLISSMTASQLANIECERSVSQMQKNLAKHEATQKEKAKEAKNKKTKQYYIRD